MNDEETLSIGLTTDLPKRMADDGPARIAPSTHKRSSSHGPLSMRRRPTFRRTAAEGAGRAVAPMAP